MFCISNQIAYADQMVYDTREVPIPLPPSGWIDVVATESEDNWIPAEGLAIHMLLADLVRASANPHEILLVSPFRDVAENLREIGRKYGIAGGRAGTIHISQGKESDVVIFVLGGHPRRPGAKAWASEKPNLLNVAVSRARRRLYIIGNRDGWSHYPYFSTAAALLAQKQTSLGAGMPAVDC
jgi:superfamily I DNA and/or RNA helicase